MPGGIRFKPDGPPPRHDDFGNIAAAVATWLVATGLTVGAVIWHVLTNPPAWSLWLTVPMISVSAFAMLGSTHQMIAILKHYVDYRREMRRSR